MVAALRAQLRSAEDRSNGLQNALGGAQAKITALDKARQIAEQLVKTRNEELAAAKGVAKQVQAQHPPRVLSRTWSRDRAEVRPNHTPLAPRTPHSPSPSSSHPRSPWS